MDGPVLVAYASKHGATAEIAGKVGDVLRRDGLRVDVLAVDRVTDLDRYAAVVLGSAVYAGRWRREAARFLRAHEAALAARPVWLFSSGPTGEGDPVRLTEGWTLPKDLRPVAERVGPRGVVVFHGRLDPDRLNALERWAVRLAKAPLGDYRDWDAITAWAGGVAAALAREDQVATARMP